jgi:hypothetical protein
MAPIVRNGVDGERELVMARWGMPGPPQFCCWLMRPRLSNCNGRCLTMRYELSRVAKRRMVRAKMPCPTGIKTQRLRFDAPPRFQPLPRLRLNRGNADVKQTLRAATVDVAVGRIVTVGRATGMGGIAGVQVPRHPPAWYRN